MLCAVYPTMDLQIRQVLIPRQRLKPWIVLASTNPKRYFSFSKGWIEGNICIPAWHVSGSIGLIEADRGVRVAWAHFSGSSGGKPKFLWVPSPEGALSSIPGFFYCNPNFTANFEKIEAGVQNSHVGATGDQLLWNNPRKTNAVKLTTNF